jgi:hypothetical protein
VEPGRENGDPDADAEHDDHVATSARVSVEALWPDGGTQTWPTRNIAANGAMRLAP